MKTSHKAKYINPFTDFGFKKLFGEEANKELLVDFLNQLLPPQHQIHELFYKKTEQLSSHDTDRKAIFDLCCESQAGHKFIVELQKAKQNFFKDRSVFYATFPIREQTQRGEWDYQLQPVYCIALLDFTFDDNQNPERYLQYIQLRNEACEVFYDKLTFIFIKMPRFKKKLEELTTHFDKWLYFIKHLESFETIPNDLRENIFEQAFAVAEIAHFNSQQQEDYENSLKYYRDLKNAIDIAVLEGKKQEKTQRICLALQQGILTPEQIAILFDVDKQFIETLKSKQ
ncbi:MAG: PD-(D/E)XK nuclease family transposase [Thioploca sp.]|nr:PD-(D/E)XK nuclease family transposase [Thioploca sp.]